MRLAGSVSSCLFALLLAACDAGGDSARSAEADSDEPPSAPRATPTPEVAASPVSASPAALAAPQNLHASPGPNQVTLSWDAVAGATGYHVYHATEAGISPDNYAAFQNGVWVKNVSRPHLVSRLPDGVVHYFVVTAFAPATESPASEEAAATPQIALTPVVGLDDSGRRR